MDHAPAMPRRLAVSLLFLAACLLAANLSLSGEPAQSAPAGPGRVSQSIEPTWGPDILVSPLVTDTFETNKNFAFAINPTDPNNIISSYNSNVSGPGTSGYSWTTDAGLTWT